jgi:hypothetical protein
MSGPVDVLATLDAAIAPQSTISSLGHAEEWEALRQVRAAVAELIESDKAYDLALGALENYYRTVSEKGYVTAQFFDARALQQSFARADSRRCEALLALAPVKAGTP